MSYNNGAVMTAMPRRRQGPAQARSTGGAGTGGQLVASGETAGGKDEGGRMKDEERRAVMVGHTVRILADYDGLQGRYGTVVGPAIEGSAVLVRITGSDRQVCFTSREIAVVPMNMVLCDQPTEKNLLIVRAVRLNLWPKWHGVEASPALKTAALRRSEKLLNLAKAIQRESQTLGPAQWSARNGLSNYTTAVMLWTGGAR